MRSRPPYEPYPRQRGGQRSRSLLVGLPLFAACAAFGSIVWLAYVDRVPGSALDEPPLIVADSTPIKLPPDQGGVDERGDVLSEVFEERTNGGGGDAQLLPEVERPLPPPSEPTPPESPEAAEDDGAGVSLADRLDVEAAADQESDPANGGTSPSEAGATNADPSNQALAAASSSSAEPPSSSPAPIPAAQPPTPTSTGPTPPPSASTSGGADPSDAGPTSAGPAPRPATPASSGSGTGGPSETDPVLNRLLRQVRGERSAPAVPPEAGTARPTEPAAPPPASRSEPTPRPATSPASGSRPPGNSQLTSPSSPNQTTAQLVRPRPTPSARPAAPVAVTPGRDAGPVQPVPSSPRVGGPTYRIQLAAVRDEADARRAWDLFRLDLSDLLTGVEPIIERAETANGVFYRVQVGPFAALEQAERLCEDLKQRNANCFVIRR